MIGACLYSSRMIMSVYRVKEFGVRCELLYTHTV